MRDQALVAKLLDANITVDDKDSNLALQIAFSDAVRSRAPKQFAGITSARAFRKIKHATEGDVFILVTRTGIEPMLQP